MIKLTAKVNVSKEDIVGMYRDVSCMVLVVDENLEKQVEQIFFRARNGKGYIIESDRLFNTYYITGLKDGQYHFLRTELNKLCKEGEIVWE